jgi:hypothetical protein
VPFCLIDFLNLTDFRFISKAVPVEPKANQKKAKNESKSMRQQNYTDAEDVQLCNLWLNVAQDPVIGINQTGSGFCMRVAEKYLKVIPKPNQNSVGLKNRWATLQGAINFPDVFSRSPMPIKASQLTRTD